MERSGRLPVAAVIARSSRPAVGFPEALIFDRTKRALRPGVAEAILQLNRKHWYAVVVTDKPNEHARKVMETALGQVGIKIDAVGEDISAIVRELNIDWENSVLKK